MFRPTLLVLSLALAGCSQAPDADVPASPVRHDVEGPIAVVYTMEDGVELHGTLWRPVGAQSAPVVIHAQVYASGCTPGAAPPGYVVCSPPTREPGYIWYLYEGLGLALVENGSMYLDINMRGSGPSGGCFSVTGDQERRDLERLIDEVSRMDGSNGRVGMTGISYMGATPFQAMSMRPPALKAIVPSGIVTDEYTFVFTPQGAATLASSVDNSHWVATVGLVPALGHHDLVQAMAVAPERLCPETLEALAAYPLSNANDARPRDFFLERRNLDKIANQDVGVLIVHGLQDNVGHGFQEDLAWEALEGTPRGMVLGQWGHTTPYPGTLDGSGLEWPAFAVEWFEHFLDDGPVPSLLGRVAYQSATGGWHTADAWPPMGNEVLYVGADLGTAPQGEGLAFRSVAGSVACGPAGTWASAVTDPLPHAVHLAGNPMAWLQLRVDGPSALVAVDLWDVPGDDVCEGTLITSGAADLRFLDDPFQGRDVPTGTPLGVRIDFLNAAHEVAAGHRIGITFSGQGAFGAVGRTGAGVEILPGPDSHLVLPMHGAGAPPPMMDYPVRPLGVTWEAP